LSAAQGIKSVNRTLTNPLRGPMVTGQEPECSVPHAETDQCTSRLFRGEQFPRSMRPAATRYHCASSVTFAARARSARRDSRRTGREGPHAGPLAESPQKRGYWEIALKGTKPRRSANLEFGNAARQKRK